MRRKYKTEIIELTDEELRRELAELEGTYGMTCQEFLLRYNTGQLGDDLEFIHWSGLLRIAAKVGLTLPIRTGT